MVHLDNTIITKKVIRRLILDLENNDFSSVSFDHIQSCGLREFFSCLINKIRVHFPSYGNGYNEVALVHTLTIVVFVDILKRSLLTNMITLDFQTKYIPINHRIEITWS